MKRTHGTYVAYVIDRCRCADCRRANREYERARAARLEPAYVSAGPARAHLAMLAAAGVGLKQVAKVSGVSTGTLSKLVYGDGTRGLAPSKRVRKATADRILAVWPSALAAGARVDAAATWRLIDEMVAAGVPKARIAERLGTGPGLQLSRKEVTVRSARTVAEFHADWQAGRVAVARRHRHRHIVVPPPPPTPVPREIAFAAQARRSADVSALYIELAEVVELRNSQPWRAQVACRSRPIYLWFPARGDHRTAAKATQICQACPVRDRCRAEMFDEPAGIYGALSAGARRRVRRADSAERVPA